MNKGGTFGGIRDVLCVGVHRLSQIKKIDRRQCRKF